jgi:hypothetical protein
MFQALWNISCGIVNQFEFYQMCPKQVSINLKTYLLGTATQLKCEFDLIALNRFDKESQKL